MGKIYKALIKRELLIWARKSAHMDTDEAATRIGVPEEQLRSWEDGADRPTIHQLRKTAHVYRQTFAAFYLPTPPEIFQVPVHDYRLLHDNAMAGLSSELVMDIRLATDRRGVCFELLADEKKSPPAFSLQTDIKSDPEEVAVAVRDFLGVSLRQQSIWGDSRVGFNSWREALEKKGVLVFQATEVAVSEMRGYSVAQFPLPLIVVNRKDTYEGRSFSLMHELGHLMLRVSGLCDMGTDKSARSADAKLEIFCNHLSGAVLVPAEHLLSNSHVIENEAMEWEDAVIQRLARSYSVSREVILRRLLILGRTTEEFYQFKRQEFQAQYKRRKSTGFVTPAVDVVSSAGKTFSRLVIDAYNTGRINASDVSEIFGVRLKHFEQIGQAVAIG